MIVFDLKATFLLSAVGAAVVLGASAGSAAAQSTAGQYPGVPGAGSSDTARRFAVQLLGSAVYDSNTARGSTAVAAVRGVEKGDYTYTPSVSIDAMIPIGRESVFLVGTAGYNFRQFNRKLQSENINLRGGGTVGVGPCTVSLTAGVARGQSDLADLALSVTENVQQTTSAGVGAACSPLIGVGTEFGYQYSHLTNTARGDIVDSTQQGYSGGLNYTNRLLGTLSLVGSYSESDYAPRGPSAALTPAGFKQYGVSLALQRAIGKRLSGQASVGYSKAEPRTSTSSSNRGFTGVTGAGALTYRINTRASANLFYQRSATATMIPGADYAISDVVAMSTSYRLSSRLNAAVGAGYTRRSYRGLQTAAVGGLTNESGENASASLAYKITQSASITLTGNYQVRNASSSNFDYSSYRVGITASTSF